MGVIDTSGMNDSQGRGDDEFNEDIIFALKGQTMVGPPSVISACVLVVKVTTELDQGWTDSVKRYLKQFEELRPLWELYPLSCRPVQ